MKSQTILFFISLFAVSTILIYYSFGFNHLSSDKRIRKLQTEAINERLYERIRQIRFNAKELFGFTRYSFKQYEENNVTFWGNEGKYNIEYKNLLIFWKDNGIAKIEFNKTLVYEAKGKNHITAYHKGSWLEEFNEMYKQATKGIPIDEEAKLKRRWGIE